MQKITVRLDKNYGTWVFYPVCYEANLFAAMAGTKTLKQQTLQYIEKLGYEIEIAGTQQNWKEII
jgi:hypothetical protein